MSRIRHKNVPYECTRCGYSTEKKSCMFNHFYKTKNLCPGSLNEIELTEEIKEHILKNRTYKIPQDNTTKMVKNYQMINAFITNADSYKKINSVLDYENKLLISYGDQIEKTHNKRIEMLQNNGYKYGFKLEEDDITDMIDRSTQVKNSKIEELNVLFFDKLNRIALYHDEEWQELRAEKGIQQIVRIHQTCFLETYEIYVLKRMYQDDHHDARTRSKFREQLKDYYRYLSIFDLMPFAYQKENSEIIETGPYYNVENENYIEEQAMIIYNEAKKELKKNEVNKCKKTLTELIKRNNQANFKQLNETLSSFINMDEQFKTQFLHT